MGDASEALEAFAEQRAKFEEEIAEKVAAYEAVRAEQRAKEDEEIQQLKEKQARRREEREKEEQERMEREREEEHRRKAEEEERKQKMAAEKARREANKRKGAKDAFALAGGPIVITKKQGDGEDKDKVKRVVGPSPEELEAKKQEFLSNICRPTDLSCMGPEDIKRHIEKLHERVCRVVADTYDLEKRFESQEYDYKELIGREKQQARAKAIRMGLDPDEAENSKHPPKLKIVTKYDRQIDRRSYSERMKVYNAPQTAPHFPGVGPPEVKLEKKILQYDEAAEEGGEDEAGEEEEAAAEEEAEEEEAEEEEE